MTPPTKMLIAAEKRRHDEVAPLLRRKWTQTRIADHLGVTVQTVCKDVKLLRAEWAEKMKREWSALVSEAWEELDEVCRAAWDKFLDEGRTEALNVVLKALDQRAKLLGLNAPERREITGASGRPLAVEIQEAMTDPAYVEWLRQRAAAGPTLEDANGREVAKLEDGDGP